jgi:hypothetical protein
MEMKSKCVNLLNKLAYEVCNVKKEQEKILEKLEINNQILDFNNSLNSEILNIDTCYSIRIEEYDLLRCNNHKLILMLLCLYLNQEVEYNFYYPLFSNKNQKIVRVVIIKSEQNILRETINYDNILEDLRGFMDFLECKDYNSRKVVLDLFDFIRDLERISLCNYKCEKYNKPSEILKLKNNKENTICDYVKNNINVKNKVSNLYNSIKEIIETSEMELLTEFSNDVNNPYKKNFTFVEVIENGKKLLLENFKKIDEQNMHNDEPYEPSDYTTLTDLQDFDLTNDDTEINNDILYKLKNILEITTNSEIDTDTFNN